MRKFPYIEPLEENQEYIKDRDALFRANGNGWWCATPRKYNRKSSQYHNRVTAQERQGYTYSESEFPNAGFVIKENESE